MRHILPLTLLCLLMAAPVQADVVTTRSGLRIEGEATKRADGSWDVRTPKGAIHLSAERVLRVQDGVSPRADWQARAAKVPADNAAGHYRLALEAEQAGHADLALRAYERVIAVDSDHRAARRALGYERVGDKWESRSEARRKQGLVLYAGTWLLPEQVERASLTKVAVRAPRPSTVETVIRTLASEEAPLRDAARLSLAD